MVRMKNLWADYLITDIVDDGFEVRKDMGDCVSKQQLHHTFMEAYNNMKAGYTYVQIHMVNGVWKHGCELLLSNDMLILDNKTVWKHVNHTSTNT